MEIINYEGKGHYHKIIKCNRKELKGLELKDFIDKDLIFVSKYRIEIDTKVPCHGRVYLKAGNKLLSKNWNSLIPKYIQEFLE